MLEVAKLLGLSERDVDMLYGAFRAIDQDESGQICCRI